jgi:hypothetical protein
MLLWLLLSHGSFMTFTLNRVGQLEKERGVLANGFYEYCTNGVLWLELAVAPDADESATPYRPIAATSSSVGRMA